ncbi:MAG: 50S ribosomal protein L4 [bacterium]|nr:50S ribosomal protein L4 [bacterium]
MSKKITESVVVKKAVPVKKPVIKRVAKKETVAAEVLVEAPRSAKKSVSMKVIDVSGKDAGTMQAPGEIFSANVNTVLIAQAVRVHLANQRAGTSSTKTRGEVTGSTRKIYRQKGTGRARHGGIRAPIFVGGGIVFGPKPRDHSLHLTKKMTKLALFGALSAKRMENAIMVVSGMEKMAPKTKDAAKFFAASSLFGKAVLLVTDNKAENVKKAARNLPNVSIVPFTQLSTYIVTKADNVVFLQEAVKMLQGHFLKGEK